MKIRQQLLLITAGAILLPLAAVMLVVRAEMTDRLTAQHEARVSSLIASVSSQLAREAVRLGEGAITLLSNLEADDRFRLGLTDADRQGYVRDTGLRLISAARLDVFQVQGGDGRILTSGHFRMDFGRVDRRFSTLNESDSLLVAEMRVPEGWFPALVHVRPFTMFGDSYRLILGTRVDDTFLNRMAPDSLMAVGLIYDGGLVAGKSIRGLARDLPFRYLERGTAEPSPASIRVAHSLDDIDAVIESLDRWLLIAFALVSLASIAMAWFVARRFTQPISDLAEATALVELDRASTRPFARRRDEIGQLSRTLDSMVRRLRVSAGDLRDAERRATLGDFARQANHDIKNGLTPIRNVFRHLSEVAGQPKEFASVFKEREETITSGIEYLDRLATAYARLSIASTPRPLDASKTLREVGASFSATDSRVSVGRTQASPVMADALALRRMLENLVSNALDSLPQGSGSVVLSTKLEHETVELMVSDSGEGIPEAIRERLFEDFFTTKDKGSGLGLSIVRRLAMDMNGSVRVESEVGSGASFIIRLPLLKKA